MDIHTATELAYKNGYKQGKKDGIKEFAKQLKKLCKEQGGVVYTCDIDELLKETECI